MLSLLLQHMNRLFIAQYNTHVLLKIISSLLADLYIKCVDIIAIQESYFLHSFKLLHCLTLSSFILAYKKDFQQTVFLIHKLVL